MAKLSLRRTLKRHQLLLLSILWLGLLDGATALKCRSDDGISDAELKRVSRACMRRIGDGSYTTPNRDAASNTGGGSNGGYQQHGYGQHQQQQLGQGQGQGQSQSNYGTYGHGSRYDYYDGEEGEEEERRMAIGMGYDRNEDAMRQRHRQRTQQQQRSRRSPTTSSTSASGRSSSTTGGGGGGGGGNGGGSGNQRSKHNNNNGGNKNNTSSDNACVVYCFLEEMNMLNNEGYPERSKVSYMLTKDLRDRDLRNFYTDTIQECFQYLESLRRRDKCQVARELINCMSEYAKANCEDWQQYNMIFN